MHDQLLASYLIARERDQDICGGEEVSYHITMAVLLVPAF
jgi:hypothetical protein